MSGPVGFMQMPQQTLDHWKRVGKLLGYPECCVADFMIVMLPRRESVFTGTGFIPCAVCAERDQAEVWREINANRHKDLPEFPVDDMKINGVMDKILKESM